MTIVAPNFKAAMAAFESAQDATYSVAWLDCLGTGNNFGRSIEFPALTLNRLIVCEFNALYYRAGARKTSERLVD